MRRIFITVILLLVVFKLFFCEKVNAQNLTLSFPGFTCGVAEDPQKNKCCAVYYPSKFIPPDLGPLNILLTNFQFLIETPTRLILQPLINLIKNNEKPCYSGVPSTNDIHDPNCKCVAPITPSPSYLKTLVNFCQSQSTLKERKKCLDCINKGGIWSGVGCVHTDTKEFLQKTVFSWGIGLAGTVALLCIVYSAFTLETSQGNPEKLKKAQELLTSCIMGLLLIIFSMFILKLIGVNILQLPGFGK